MTEETASDRLGQRAFETRHPSIDEGRLKFLLHEVRVAAGQSRLTYPERDYIRELCDIAESLTRPLGEGEEELCERIYRVLRSHFLTNLGDGDGGYYPLVDAVSNEAPADISTGEEQLRLLAEEVTYALRPAPPQAKETKLRTLLGRALAYLPPALYIRREIEMALSTPSSLPLAAEGKVGLSSEEFEAYKEWADEAEHAVMWPKKRAQLRLLLAALDRLAEQSTPSPIPPDHVPRSAVEPLIKAARGLSLGVDWNKGTAARTHGYRRKLIAALPAAEAALSAAPQPPSPGQGEREGMRRILEEQAQRPGLDGKRAAPPSSGEVEAVARVDQLMSAIVGTMMEGGKPSESDWVADAKSALLDSIRTLSPQSRWRRS